MNGRPYTRFPCQLEYFVGKMTNEGTGGEVKVFGVV